MLADLTLTLDLLTESGTILRHTLNTAEQYLNNIYLLFKIFPYLYEYDTITVLANSNVYVYVY